MQISYLDTSAAMKLLVAETGSAELTAALSIPDRRIAASWLLHAELHCASGRHPDEISPERLRAILDRVLLIDITRGDLISAGTLAPLRSQDAIHLATAIRIGADEIITYDQELLRAAEDLGIHAISPGASTPG